MEGGKRADEEAGGPELRGRRRQIPQLLRVSDFEGEYMKSLEFVFSK